MFKGFFNWQQQFIKCLYKNYHPMNNESKKILLLQFKSMKNILQQHLQVMTVANNKQNIHKKIKYLNYLP